MQCRDFYGHVVSHTTNFRFLSDQRQRQLSPTIEKRERERNKKKKIARPVRQFGIVTVHYTKKGATKCTQLSEMKRDLMYLLDRC